MNSPERIFVTKLAGMGGNAGDRIRGMDFGVLPIGLGVASGPNIEGRKSELEPIPLMVAWPLLCAGASVATEAILLGGGREPRGVLVPTRSKEGGGKLVKGLQIPI